MGLRSPRHRQRSGRHDDLSALLRWVIVLPGYKGDARLSIFAPSGDDDQGRLANVGQNYGTFEPGVVATWLNSNPASSTFRQVWQIGKCVDIISP